MSLISAGMVWTKVRNGYYLDRHQITEFEGTRSMINCAIKCSKYGPKSCDSFNFNPVLKLCQLNAHRNGYPESDLVKSNVMSVWMAVYADTINFWCHGKLWKMILKDIKACLIYFLVIFKLWSNFSYDKLSLYLDQSRFSRLYIKSYCF